MWPGLYILLYFSKLNLFMLILPDIIDYELCINNIFVFDYFPVYSNAIFAQCYS